MEIKITTKKAEVNITCSAEELVIISQQPAFKEFTDLLLDHAKCHDDPETEAMVQNAEEISRRMDELLKSWNI